MPRRPRVDVPGAIHHVMNRGVDHQRVFFADEDRTEFGARLAAIHAQFGVETLAYCLMDNHFHVLLRTPDGGLPDAMQHLALVYTRHTNDRLGRDGPLFRGRYHSILVTTDAYLLCATRYIHRNALDLPGIAAPADYRWSSYRAYLGLRRAPSFLRTDVVLEQFGHDRNAVARFTEPDVLPDGAASALTVADLLQLVQLEVAADDLSHGDENGRSWLGRTALLLVSERLEPGALRRELAEHLRFPSSGARYAAVHRAEGRCRTDPAVERVVRAVLAQVRSRTRAA